MEPLDLVDERHRWLLDRLAEQRRIITNDAARELGVSVDTVRRDLRTLHQQGLLHRVHGGAVPVTSLSNSFNGRTGDESPSRAALAAAVVGRLRAGDVIGLDAGSTNVEIASQIPQSLELTIVTNSPAAAMALADHGSAEVVLLGGLVDLTWMATTGAETVDAWRDHHLDLAVLGACSFDPAAGVSTRSRNEVQTKRALMASAAETVLPLQLEKLGGRAPFHVADVADVDSLIVESLISDDLIERCRSAGIDVVMA